jgi:hypothetical protein
MPTAVENIIHIASAGLIFFFTNCQIYSTVKIMVIRVTEYIENALINFSLVLLKIVRQKVSSSK